MDSNTTIAQLRQKIKEMYTSRKWSNKAKITAISLVLEASELLEHFQFSDGEKSDKAEIASEVADIVIYLCEFCDGLDIDISDAFAKKLKIIEKKYPVNKDVSHTSKFYFEQKKKYRK